MRKFLKVIVPLLLSIAIILSIGWYLFEYDTKFTQNFLLQQASRFEEDGNYKMAVWFYDLAYQQSEDNDQVAIELAQQFKDMGNFTKAEYTLSKAIEDGGSVELYIALCQTYVEQDKLLDAVQMLGQVHNPDIKAQLDTLRPDAPTASSPSGFYSEYLSIQLSAPSGSIYCSLSEEYPSVRSDLYEAPLMLPSGSTSIWAIAVGENGLVSIPSVFSYTIGNVVEEVHFADSAMEGAIREALGITGDRTIYSNELWNITEFTIPSTVLSCEDLKWLVNLKDLTVDSCTLDSLSALESLHMLESVTVKDSILSTKDLVYIAALPRLTALTLTGCGLSSIENLSQATGLLYLDLSNNSIRDTTPLLGMTQLQALSLAHNALVNLEAVSQLPALQKLDVSYNSVVSTAPLSALTGLQKLDVSGNGLMKLEGLDGLVNLQEFASAYNQLIDVDILKSCTALQKLDVSHNHLLNISVVAGMPNLQELNFSHNEVTSLPKFASGTPMTMINGSYNSISSISALGTLSRLQYVYMDYNQKLSSIDILTACKDLQIVNVFGTKVRNVSKLTAMGVLVHYNPV